MFWGKHEIVTNPRRLWKTDDPWYGWGRCRSWFRLEVHQLSELQEAGRIHPFLTDLSIVRPRTCLCDFLCGQLIPIWLHVPQMSLQAYSYVLWRPPSNECVGPAQLYVLYHHVEVCNQNGTVELLQSRSNYLVVPVSVLYDNRLIGSHSKSHHTPLKDRRGFSLSMLNTTPDDRNSSFRPAAAASYSIQTRGTPARSSERFCRLPPPLQERRKYYLHLQ